MSARNIDEVIRDLDRIIEQSLEENNASGYFAALYSKVTIAVKDGIKNDRFEDGQRMEKLDVIFANRYIDAYNGYKRDQTISKSWQLALTGTEKWWPIVLQHLLSGMNAHINLDLGIAAAQTSPGESLQSLKNDFNEINLILSGLVDEVQKELSEIWPFLRILDKIAGKIDERLVNFSMDKARDAAWNFAEELAFLEQNEFDMKVIEKDNWVSLLGMKILHMGYFSLLPRLIRITERGNVADKIRLLI